MFIANISFFHKFDNLAAILNLLAYFTKTQPEMHVYLDFYVCTHHKYSKKPYVIKVHSRLHLAPSEAGLLVDNATGHSVSMDNLRVLDRVQDWMKRKVKEAIHIKQRAPSMNRDQGYQLPPIYGQITHPDHCVIKIC